MRQGIERLMTCLALLFLGALAAVFVLDGLDREAIRRGYGAGQPPQVSRTDLPQQAQVKAVRSNLP